MSELFVDIASYNFMDFSPRLRSISAAQLGESCFDSGRLVFFLTSHSARICCLIGSICLVLVVQVGFLVKGATI